MIFTPVDSACRSPTIHFAGNAKKLIYRELFSESPSISIPVKSHKGVKMDHRFMVAEQMRQLT
jgi:hypothetical protein